MIVSRIERYMLTCGMPQTPAKLVVGLSGGADSVALAVVLQRLGYELLPVHCHFGLRGKEADADEAFVRRFCSLHGLTPEVAHFDTRAHAARCGISVEMAARELRYRFFEEVRCRHKAAAIAVGHHRDDQAETLLLNLIRGTGLRGLRGMQPVREKIIRPLLSVWRQEIEDFLQREGEPFVTDQTNLVSDVQRNKVRLQLMPLLQQINPEAKEHLVQTAERLAQVEKIYDAYMAEARHRVSVPGGYDIDALLASCSPRAVLFELLHPCGMNSATIADLFEALTAEGTKLFHTPTHRIIKHGKRLLVEEAQTQGTAIAPKLCCTEVALTKDFVLPREKNTACLDADKLQGQLHLRLWQAGDRFQPLGMRGTKLVSDYMTDRKFTPHQRENQWLLCCGDQIVWVVGERIDHRFRLTAQSRRAVIFECTE